MWIASSSRRRRCGDRPERSRVAGGTSGVAARAADAEADIATLLSCRSLMDSAFGLVEAAPAAGARVLAGTHRRGTGRAADRGEAPGDQRMRWQAVPGGVGGDLGAAPARERIDLDVRGILLEHRQIQPCRGLEALAAGDPG